MVKFKTSASRTDFHRPAVANQLRFRAKGLFVFDYDVWEKIAAFWHGF